MAHSITAQPAPVTAEQDQPALLTDLTARATQLYAIKDYPAAAELYSQATELQASLNGDLAPENAEILYLYGRCLYHVGVSKSDVLGGKSEAGAKEKQQQTSKKRKGGSGSKGTTDAETATATVTSAEERIAEEVVTKVVEQKDGMIKPGSSTVDGAAPGSDDKSLSTKKPFFQITGDDNWDSDSDSDEGDEDGEDAEANGDGETEEDDLTAAWDVLDLARILFARKLEALEEHLEQTSKGKSTHENAEVQHLKTRLADSHDLLAEISLEGERFPAAVADFRSSLTLRKDLYPRESGVIAEGHYKLSLALEFAATTTTGSGEGDGNGDGGEEGGAKGMVDEAGREEAAKEMEQAIASCRLRLEREAGLLAGSDDESKAAREKEKITAEAIADLKDMIADMEQRVVELRNPQFAVEGGGGAADAAANPLSGLLGSILGEAPAEQRKRLEEATREATDLTGLVRKKEKEEGVNGGKRKAVAFEEGVGNGKKARVEDGGE